MSLGISVYSFLAGILVSLGINLLTEALSELFTHHSLTPFFRISSSSALFLIAASVVCMLIVVQYEQIREEAEKEAKRFPVQALAQDVLTLKLKGEGSTKMRWYRGAVFALVLLSLAAWIVGYFLFPADDLSRTDSKSRLHSQWHGRELGAEHLCPRAGRCQQNTFGSVSLNHKGFCLPGFMTSERVVTGETDPRRLSSVGNMSAGKLPDRMAGLVLTLECAYPLSCEKSITAQKWQYLGGFNI